MAYNSLPYFKSRDPMFFVLNSSNTYWTGIAQSI